tara:strand:- start:424 stop:1257 length:834 start_codon:yes stop_codon:yes gene_type:complete
MTTSTLKSSKLWENIEKLLSLSGSFYLYEPRERCRNSGHGSPLEWAAINPNEADYLHDSDLSDSSLSLCCTLGGGASRYSALEIVEKITEKKLWGEVTLLYVSDFTGSSDYSGGLHYLSNCEVLLEEYGSPECRELIGGYGSKSVAIDPRYLSEELLESLESLENYPVLDEEHWSELGEKFKTQAFDDWVESDLRRYVEEALVEALTEGGVREREEAEEEAEEIAENASDDTLWEILSEADSDGSLWEEEYNSMYCRINRIDSSLIVDKFLTSEAVK